MNRHMLIDSEHTLFLMVIILMISDCPDLHVSPETLKSTQSTYFDETVQLECPTGYTFHLEKYSENRSLTLKCSGEWLIGNDAVVEIPECRSKYTYFSNIRYAR